MKPRRAARLAWGACAAALGLISCASVLAAVGQRSLAALDFPLVGISAAVVGGLVASRRPGNPVGWLFLGVALFGGLQALAGEYAIYGLIAEPGSVPLARAAAGLSKSVEVVGPVLGFILLPLYFPNGRLVSPLWRPVAWLVLGLLPVATAMVALSPGEAVYGTGIRNPLAVEALEPVSDVANPVFFTAYIGLIFVAAASLAVRLIRSGREERQQIKWFAYAAALIPVWFVLNAPVERAFPALFGLLDSLVISTVPVAAGIAILRHRLYDIDVLINRTLVYAVLTVSLALVYFGSVVGLQYVFRALGGGESSLAIVASTLLIAALFNPLRRRVQGFIDRRFYREKYDAENTLRKFSGVLRDETDLDQLTPELLAVVRETVQPAHASLWLLPGRGEDVRDRRGG